MSKRFNIDAVMHFREVETNCLVDFRAPFPVKPDDSLIYQALKAACEQDVLELYGRLEFVDRETSKVLSDDELNARAYAYDEEES